MTPSDLVLTSSDELGKTDIRHLVYSSRPIGTKSETKSKSRPTTTHHHLVSDELTDEVGCGCACPTPRFGPAEGPR